MITRKQAQVLEFVSNYLAFNNYAPSVREIQKGVGHSSTSSVWQLLRELQDRSVIRRIPGKHRSIEILKWPSRVGDDE